jgi:hypothetical protein
MLKKRARILPAASPASPDLDACWPMNARGRAANRSLPAALLGVEGATAPLG